MLYSFVPLYATDYMPNIDSSAKAPHPIFGKKNKRSTSDGGSDGSDGSGDEGEGEGEGSGKKVRIYIHVSFWFGVSSCTGVGGSGVIALSFSSVVFFGFGIICPPDDT